MLYKLRCFQLLIIFSCYSNIVSNFKDINEFLNPVIDKNSSLEISEEKIIQHKQQIEEEIQKQTKKFFFHFLLDQLKKIKITIIQFCKKNIIHIKIMIFLITPLLLLFYGWNLIVLISNLL